MLRMQKRPCTRVTLSLTRPLRRHRPTQRVRQAVEEAPMPNREVPVAATEGHQEDPVAMEGAAAA